MPTSSFVGLIVILGVISGSVLSTLEQEIIKSKKASESNIDFIVEQVYDITMISLCCSAC